jgi:hypothetical protein
MSLDRHTGVTGFQTTENRSGERHREPTGSAESAGKSIQQTTENTEHTEKG